jgi:hypothetical protein
MGGMVLRAQGGGGGYEYAEGMGMVKGWLFDSGPFARDDSRHLLTRLHSTMALSFDY